jgi:hypothetical protein
MKTPDPSIKARRPFRRNVARRCGAPGGPWKHVFFFGENHGFFTTFTRKQLRFNQEKGMCFFARNISGFTSQKLRLKPEKLR